MTRSFVCLRGACILKEQRKGNIPQQVTALAAPLAADLGLRLWDVVYQKEGADWYLRLLIDKDAGISIDDCVDMTHAIDPVLDQEDLIAGEYLLEVSSPGINRRLTKQAHFQAYLHSEVYVRLRKAGNHGSKELVGTLMQYGDDGMISIRSEGDQILELTPAEYTVVKLVDDIDMI